MGWKALYCIVCSVLLVVLGVLFARFSSERARVERARVEAEQLLDGAGPSNRNPPSGSIPALAREIASMAHTYDSVRTDAGNPTATAQLNAAATRVGMSRLHAGTIIRDVDRKRGFETLSRKLTYDTCTLEQLVALIYNIESAGLMRVSDVRWQLADKKLNAEPPFHRIARPQIEVGFRAPIQRR